MKKIIQIAILFIFSWSCSDEPVETVIFDLDTKNGVFITCEGNFMYGNASLSFYNTKTQKVTKRLFYARNNAPLGDVAQSVSFFNNLVFIVVNNSGKIVVANPETAEYRGTVTGLTSPRSIHFISKEKAYVSDLYASHITVINPATLEKTSKIGLENHTSEQMIQLGKYVFVSSWVNDEFILVIDSETDERIAKIKVPFQPKDLEADKNGKIWVLSEGSYEQNGRPGSEAALSRIDPATFTVEQIYRFQNEFRPSSLALNKQKDSIYYINNGVYKMSIDSRRLPDRPILANDEKLFYNLAVSPVNNDIYLADAIDYTQDAVVYRYSRDAELIDSFRVGINPSDFLFR